MTRKLIGYFYLMKDMNHSMRHLVCVMVSLTFADGQTLVFPPYGHSFGIRKATQAKLFIFLPFARFEDPQGLATAKMLSRDDPATEKEGAQYYWMGTDVTQKDLWHDTRKDEFTMEVALTEYSYVSLFSTRNNDTAFFIKKLFIWPGKRSIPLVNGAHALSSGGSCILRIEPSYSSYTYYHWDYPLIVKER